jgi:hypothetical protein
MSITPLKMGSLVYRHRGEIAGRLIGSYEELTGQGSAESASPYLVPELFRCHGGAKNNLSGPFLSFPTVENQSRVPEDIAVLPRTPSETTDFTQGEH